MARLTRSQRKELEAVSGHLRRAFAYIRDARTAVALRSSFASTTLHYTRADGAILYEVDKEIGSDLTGLEMGLNRLESFLDRDMKPIVD